MWRAIKIFMWWACHHWLPTMAYLAKRGVHTNGYCPRCQKFLETMVHALWGCRELRSVKEKCHSFNGFKGSNDMHFLDFILGWLRNLCSTELEFLCVIFWRIWFCRNQMIHNKAGVDNRDVVKWASDFIDEWRSISQVDTLPTSGSVPVQNWTPSVDGI
ncbi:hypothetical protein LWI29_017969 [Acer saccharum]|uniref:Reverse transcriptase zinc-binding domain-containing protein n=1 Tax=Acer saccharum TaxID=4024 RepID=A0AA39T4N8_ACESA|nr:hypothetical protein LWI29_017969 [Acer saccharum]